MCSAREYGALSHRLCTPDLDSVCDFLFFNEFRTSESEYDVECVVVKGTMIGSTGL